MNILQCVYFTYFLTIPLAELAKVPFLAHDHLCKENAKYHVDYCLAYYDWYDSDELKSSPVQLPRILTVSVAMTPVFADVRWVLQYLIVFYLWTELQFLILCVMHANICSEVYLRFLFGVPAYPAPPNYRIFIIQQGAFAAIVLILDIAVRVINCQSSDSGEE